MASPLYPFTSPPIPFPENEVKFFVVALNFAIEPIPWSVIQRDGKIVKNAGFCHPGCIWKPQFRVPSVNTLATFNPFLTLDFLRNLS